MRVDGNSRFGITDRVDDVTEGIDDNPRLLQMNVMATVGVGDVPGTGEKSAQTFWRTRLPARVRPTRLDRCLHIAWKSPSCNVCNTRTCGDVSSCNRVLRRPSGSSTSSCSRVAYFFPLAFSSTSPSTIKSVCEYL